MKNSLVEAFHDEDIRWLFEDVNLKELKGKRVLDIGCDDAEMLRGFAAEYKCRAFGVDVERFKNAGVLLWFNESKERLLRFLGLQEPMKLARGDLMFLPYKKKSFELVYSVGAFPQLRSLDERLQGIREAYKVLKPGGIGIIHFHMWGLEGDTRFRARFDSDVRTIISSWLDYPGLQYKEVFINNPHLPHYLSKVVINKVGR